MKDDEIRQRIIALKPRLTALRNFLLTVGFVFENFDESLPGPDAKHAEIIRRIEEKAGKVPFALVAFYQQIGSVNFNGHHADWDGCEYPDPLMVYPAETAESELDDFLYSPDEYIEAYGSFRIPIAPDYYHKADVSGGMWYGVPVPSDSADPPLLEEPHKTTFLNYLELALEWGGFPGLENAELGNNWPLAELRNACLAIQ